MIDKICFAHAMPSSTIRRLDGRSNTAHTAALPIRKVGAVRLGGAKKAVSKAAVAKRVVALGASVSAEANGRPRTISLGHVKSPAGAEVRSTLACSYPGTTAGTKGAGGGRAHTGLAAIWRPCFCAA